MEGFYLLLAHMVGDYVLQNDWQAANKTSPHPGNRPGSYHPNFWAEWEFVPCPDRTPAWRESCRLWWVGHIACTVHCLLYTASVAAFSFWWMPWWGYVVCFGLHWVIDRFRLAGLWMRRVSGQKSFADGPLAPWSIIVVDNVFHLLTLAAIAAACWR
jgi:hypothetical protein